MKGKRGSILISTIIVFSVIVPVVVFMSYAAKMSVDTSYNYKADKEIMLSLRGVIRSLLVGIQKVPVSRLIGKSWSDGDISVFVSSNDGLLNLNAMLLPDCRTANTLYLSVYRRLCRYLALPDRTACILDYIDVDGNERVGGDERGVPNRRLLSVRELLQVPHITSDYLKKILPYVTVYSLCKVNVNYAPELLLRALDDRMTEDIVRKIVDVRRKRRICSIKDLMKIGVPPVILYRIGPMLTFRVAYITAEVRLQRGNISAEYRVVIKREKMGGKLLYVGFE